MCISPLVLKRDYRSIQNDFTNKVPCGQCSECLRRRSSGWTFRLEQEAKVSTSVVFLTLTYTDEELVWGDNAPTLHKPHLQKFIKRLRSRIGKQKKKLVYYACGEYGTKTKRPHYHAIIFNLPIKLINDCDKLQEIWSHGIVHVGTGTTGSFAYTAKYVQKAKSNRVPDGLEREFSLMSKGIGKNFLTSSMKKHLIENQVGYVTIGGYKLALPRYYREKLFTPDQKLERYEWRKAINQKAEIAREERFEKFGDVNKEDGWRREKIRKAQRAEKIRGSL